MMQKAGESRMILLVEDDSVLRRDMGEILSQNGYLVHCVENYQEAEWILQESVVRGLDMGGGYSGSTGIGLHLAHEIIERHQGHVWAYN